MFEGFAEAMVPADGLELLFRYSGEGPPILLLHGHPRTSATWHRVAPLLVDRGSYCALRLVLDHPAAVTRVALLDCVPISEHLDRADARFATAGWHWFFYAQPKIPERVILADPLAWYAGDPKAMGSENYNEWRAAVSDPEVVRGMLEDYRAGLTIDTSATRCPTAPPVGPSDRRC